MVAWWTSDKHWLWNEIPFSVRNCAVHKEKNCGAKHGTMDHPGLPQNRHCLRLGNPILTQSLQFYTNTSHIKKWNNNNLNVFRKRGKCERCDLRLSEKSETHRRSYITPRWNESCSLHCSFHPCCRLTCLWMLWRNYVRKVNISISCLCAIIVNTPKSCVFFILHWLFNKFLHFI